MCLGNRIAGSYSQAATGKLLMVLVAQKRTEERIAMSETPPYKLEKFISSGDYQHNTFPFNHS